MKISKVSNTIFTLETNPKGTDWDEVKAVADFFFNECGYVGAEACDGEFITICHEGYFEAAKTHKDYYAEFKKCVKAGERITDIDYQEAPTIQVPAAPAAPAAPVVPVQATTKNEGQSGFYTFTIPVLNALGRLVDHTPLFNIIGHVFQGYEIDWKTGKNGIVSVDVKCIKTDKVSMMAAVASMDLYTLHNIPLNSVSWNEAAPVDTQAAPVDTPVNN